VRPRDPDKDAKVKLGALFPTAKGGYQIVFWLWHQEERFRSSKRCKSRGMKMEEDGYLVD
jgi:hypothetical protein